jgi:hypothetical protein
VSEWVGGWVGGSVGETDRWGGEALRRDQGGEMKGHPLLAQCVCTAVREKNRKGREEDDVI